MHRVLSCIAALSLAAYSSAQCFESSLGVLAPGGSPTAGLGDDNLFTLQPMNINFPMAGTTAGVYTHAHISTNGVIFLTTGAASGATTTGYSTTAATMVANMQGTAGQPPRIAPYWKDLNNLAANGGGVFYNNTLPGKFVVTWKNTVRYLDDVPIFTVQAQLFATGEVRFFYSSNAPTGSCIMTGVSPGNAVASVPASNLVPGLTSTTTTFVYETFLTSPATWDLNGNTLSFMPNVSNGYDVSGAACIPSANTAYGGGCYDVFASFYENFSTAPAFDLPNSSLTLIKLPTGYVVSRTSVPLFTHVSPTALVLTDDSEAITPALTTPFPYDGGAAATLAVCSNGFISVASGNGTGFTPTVSTMLGNPQVGWYTWHDFNPGIVGSGQVKFEESGGVAYVTWDGVWNFGGASVADASTVQYQFDEATGNINIVFGSMSTTGGTGFLVGYSPAGASADPGSRDLSVYLPVSVTTDSSPGLALSAAPAPVLGNTVTYTVSNVPASLGISVVFMSFGQTAPVPLPSIGINSPGCFTHIDLSPGLGFGSISPLLLTSPTASQNLTIPSGAVWAGVTVYTQAAALAPAASPGGVITSNAVRSFLNSF